MMRSNLGGGEITKGNWWESLCLYVPFPFIAAIIALLAGSAMGILGPYASAVIIGTTFMAIIIVLRQDELAVTAVIAVHLYVDWYLGLHLVAPMMTVGLLLIFFFARSPRYPWVEPHALWLWGSFLLLTIPPAIRGALTLFDAASYYPSDIFGAFTIFWLGALIARNSACIRRFFQIFAGFGTLLAVHTLIQVTTGTVLFGTAHFDALFALKENYALLGSSDIAYRAGSFFVVPIWNGIFFAMVFFLSFALFVESSSLLEKSLYLAEMGLMLAALLFTYSIGAWVGFLGGLIAFVLCAGSTRYRVLLSLFILALAAALVVSFPSQIDILLQHAADPNELLLRTAVWQTAIGLIRAFPLTGIGLGYQNYLEREEPYRVLAQIIQIGHPHNSYLEWGAMAGLPVLLVFLLLLLFALWLALRNWALADVRSRVLIGGGVAAIIALSIGSWSNNDWTHPVLAMVGWLILGVISSPLIAKNLNRERGLLDTGKKVETVGREPTMASLDESREYKDTGGGKIRFPHITLTPFTESEHYRDTATGDGQGPRVDASPALVLSTMNIDEKPSDEEATGIIPLAQDTRKAPKSETQNSGVEGYLSLARNLIKSSGIYALSSLASPLIALILAPFLTHNLSRADYGALAVLNISIVLVAGVTQLGLGPAFFRAYNADYESPHDRLGVLSTVIILLSLVTIPTTIATIVAAPWLVGLSFHNPALVGPVQFAALAVLLQNLAVPGLSWLRAENRAAFFAILSIANLLVSLSATIVLVGALHMGITGSLIATGGGNAVVVVCTLPAILLRTGLRFRLDIGRNLLSFGLPLVSSLVSVWVLQFSDRYLLSFLGSLAQTASYTVAYTLGGALAPVIITPFLLAWPSTMYDIAKREEATQVFRLVFRWLSIVLLFAAFALSLVATVVLYTLFPPAYHSAAPVIPIIAVSIMFYGIYTVFTVGIYIKRKTWLIVIFTAFAALTNVGLNVVLIPLYGSIGAAASTLIAYAVLALIAYVTNQRIYPIPFEIVIFIIALLVGIALYGASNLLAQTQQTYIAWGIYISALGLYGGCLALLGKLPAWDQKKKHG